MLRLFAVLCFVAWTSGATAQTVTVSTADSATAGDFVGDGSCDEVQINQAIAALPAAGGTVKLAEGTYEICRGATPYGGVLIERSDVVIEGEGEATLLLLKEDQDTNVFRIKGNVSNITIRDLACDGNWETNDHPNETTLRFESTCVRAGGAGETQSRIVVANVHFWDCPRLCVVAWANFSVVRDSLFGDARSDVVELLGFGGEIVNNTAEIDATTGHVFGGDGQAYLLIAGNTVLLKPTAVVTVTIFRTYPGLGVVLANNQVKMESGAFVLNVTDLRSYLNQVDGNIFHMQRNPNGNRPYLIFNGGTTLAGNMFYAVEMVSQDTSGGWGALIDGNMYGDTAWPGGSVTFGDNRPF